MDTTKFDPKAGWSGRGRAGTSGVQYDWLTYFNVLFWNLNYWDSVSTLAGEVEEPKTMFPKALRWAVMLVSATYTLPMAVCILVAADRVFGVPGAFGSGFTVVFGSVRQQTNACSVFG